jgi:hypothetical protein
MVNVDVAEGNRGRHQPFRDRCGAKHRMRHRREHEKSDEEADPAVGDHSAGEHDR